MSAHFKGPISLLVCAILTSLSWDSIANASNEIALTPIQEITAKDASARLRALDPRVISPFNDLSTEVEQSHAMTEMEKTLFHRALMEKLDSLSTAGWVAQAYLASAQRTEGGYQNLFDL